MKVEEIHDYNDLKKYLREFKGWHNDPYSYDTGRVVGLFLALLDNLQEYFVEVDEFPYYLNDSQRIFLSHLAKYANQKSDKDIEEEDAEL